MSRISRACASLIVCALLATAQSAREKRIVPVDSSTRQSFEKQPKVAVLAGVGRYTQFSGLTHLRYPAHDVDLLESELTRQGYKVVSLKDDQATRGSIEQALRNVSELVDHGSGTVLFFFSGHGFADQGANYLATYEASAGDLAGSGLSVKRVEDLLRSTGAPRQVMFVDACRNEAGSKATAARSFAALQGASGLRALLSTKAGHISYEDDSLGSGVFTHFLVEGLRGQAAGQDGLITFRDLSDFVIDGVSTYGFKSGQMQVPYEAGEASGDFLLARTTAAAPSPAPIDNPVRRPPLPQTSPVATPVIRSRTLPRQVQSRSLRVPDTSGANWKDRDEYDSFVKAQQATDPRTRLDALNSWASKFPNTQMVDVRNQYFIDTYSKLAGTDVSMRQTLLAKALEALKTDPDNANTLYMVSLWGPIIGAANPPSDLVAQVESAALNSLAIDDAAFESSRKPQGLSDDAWKKAKIALAAKARQALAWAAVSKNDLAEAEAEYRESLTIYPDDGYTATQLGKVLFAEKRYPEALFEYARGGQYAGPGALPAAGRQQALDYFNRNYDVFHGSSEGKDQVLALARSSALPPSDFDISAAQ